MKNILKMVDMGSKKTAAFVYAVYCNDKRGNHREEALDQRPFSSIMLWIWVVNRLNQVLRILAEKLSRAIGEDFDGFQEHFIDNNDQNDQNH